VQQGPPAPPQTTHALAALQMVPEPQALPAQQDWPAPPHATQMLPLPQTDPALQLLPLQQAWPRPPQIAWQAPLPSQTLPPEQVPGSAALRTVLQVPTLPLRLHAWQLAVQVWLQQVPSTHALVAHSALPEHGLPAGLLQSASCDEEHCGGQNPSAVRLHGRSRAVHSNEQSSVLPAAVRIFAASLVHAAFLASQSTRGSHFSAPSSAPLPQIGLQSVSLVLVQPGAQQASPFKHRVISTSGTQRAAQVCARPRRPSPMPPCPIIRTTV